MYKGVNSLIYCHSQMVEVMQEYLTKHMMDEVKVMSINKQGEDFIIVFDGGQSISSIQNHQKEMK